MSGDDVCPICGTKWQVDGLCVMGHPRPSEETRLEQIRGGLDDQAKRFLADIGSKEREMIEREMEMVARPIEGGFEVTTVMDGGGLMMLSQLRAIVRDQIQTGEFKVITPLGTVDARPDDAAVDAALQLLMAAVMAEGGKQALEDIDQIIQNSVMRGAAKTIMEEIKIQGDEKDDGDEWKIGV